MQSLQNLTIPILRISFAKQKNGNVSCCRRRSHESAVDCRGEAR